MKRIFLLFAIIFLSLCIVAETPQTNPLELFSSKQSRKDVVPVKRHTQATAMIREGHQNTSAEDANTTTLKHAYPSRKPDPLAILRGEAERDKSDPREPSVDTKDTNDSLGSKIYHFFFGEGEENATQEEENITFPGEANQTFPNIEVQGKKIIYLTFDDGPVSGTANLLSVLQKAHIKATMFMVGRQMDADPKLFHKAEAMTNISVANHTYTHADGHYKQFYGHKQTVLDDIAKTQELIGEPRDLRLAGRNVWRLPEVQKNDRALGEEEVAVESPVYDALEKEGYQIFGWDIEWRFDHHTHLPRYGAEELAYRVALRYIHHTTKKEKIVVLAHDYMFREQSGVQKLSRFIAIMKQRGWTFESIETY